MLYSYRIIEPWEFSTPLFGRTCKTKQAAITSAKNEIRRLVKETKVPLDFTIQVAMVKQEEIAMPDASLLMLWLDDEVQEKAKLGAGVQVRPLSAVCGSRRAYHTMSEWLRGHLVSWLENNAPGAVQHFAPVGRVDTLRITET